MFKNISDSNGDYPEYPPSIGGATKISEIPVKDVVIVIFMLSLWIYSIMLIVRAWSKVHNLPGTFVTNNQLLQDRCHQ